MCVKCSSLVPRSWPGLAWTWFSASVSQVVHSPGFAANCVDFSLGLKPCFKSRPNDGSSDRGQAPLDQFLERLDIRDSNRQAGHFGHISRPVQKLRVPLGLASGLVGILEAGQVPGLKFWKSVKMLVKLSF